MNISPISNTQPSFKGVIVNGVYNSANEPAVVSATFHVVPDNIVRGIKFEGKEIPSIEADILTREFTNSEHSGIDSEGTKIFRRIIEQLGLEHRYKDSMLKLIKNKKSIMTICFPEYNQFVLEFRRFYI